jgi:hypothetical protein
MLFVLAAHDELGKVREVSIVLEKLEDGLDLLNNIVALGHTLLKVNVIDQDSNTSLPVGLFDGASFAKPIQRLEFQWRSIFARYPKSSESSYKRTAMLFQQKVDKYEQQIRNLDIKITDLRGQLERVSGARISPALRPALIQHFWLILTTHEQHRARLHSLRKQSMIILSQIR